MKMPNPQTKRDLRVLTKGSEYIVLDEDTGRWVRINGVGLEILKLCNGSSSPTDIISDISSRYDVPPAMIKDEIENFITASAKYGLVWFDEPPHASFSDKLVTLWFHVTNKCNLNCIYCYYDSKKKGAANQLGIDRINNILSEVDSFSPTLVYITGGEPLVREDILDIKPGKSRLRLVTNGTLINEDHAKRIAKVFPEIQISLDGSRPSVHDKQRGKHTFEKVIEAAKIVAQEKFKLKLISCTVTKLNYSNVPDLLSLAYDMGFGLFLSRAVPIGRGNKKICLSPLEYHRVIQKCREEYLKLKEAQTANHPPFFFTASCTPYLRVVSKVKYRNCGLGINTMSIDHLGNVFPCPLLHVPDKMLGNLVTTTFSELRKKAIQTYTSLSVDNIEGCNGCNLKYICGGGCRAVAKGENGDFLGKDPYCETMRGEILELMFGM